MQANATPPLKSRKYKALAGKFLAAPRHSVTRFGLSTMAYCQQYSLVYWCAKATKVDEDEKGASNNFVAVSVPSALVSVSS